MAMTSSKPEARREGNGMLSREMTSKINYIFDHLLPPALRDARWFMNIWFSIVFHGKKGLFMDFKQNVHSMSNEEFAKTYLDTRDSLLKRKTDLNKQCIEAILENIAGGSVIDIGCGSGYMVERLRQENPHKHVFGMDIALTDGQLEKDYYFSGFAEDISVIGDGEFDTVVCSHVLEHVRNFDAALSEIRRIAARRLIIVLPCQREYKYTFDLHIRFFPYPHSFLSYIHGGGDCALVGGDIFYIEDRRPDAVGIRNVAIRPSCCK